MRRTPQMPVIFSLLLLVSWFAVPIAWGQAPAVADKKPEFSKAVRVNVIASKPSAIKGGDYDDKMQVVQLRAKFSNEHPKFGYDQLKATISAFGRSTEDSAVITVLHQESFDVKIDARQSFEHTCQRVTTRYDKTGAKFGFFYDGWVIVVQDQSGNIVYIKSTSPQFEKTPDKVLALKANGFYTRALESTSSPSIYIR